jgi:CRP-like cAMP-binding protein
LDSRRGTENRLLAKLPDETRTLLDPLLEQVTLKQNEVLFEPHQPIKFVYFFKGGLSSEIAVNSTEHIEVGCIGREGMSGLAVLLGASQTPHRSFMQAGGPATRIRAEDLLRVFNESQPLRTLLLRYVHVFTIQVAATALANGRYNVEQRLARWLLMSHDRLDDALPLTHDFLALMLGVRRPSVTGALHVLEGEHLIKADRGLITIRDRQGLVAFAGESYGMAEAEYERLISEAAL